MNDCLAYDDVLLVPQYSDIRSRAEIDISSRLDENLALQVPIISAPMDTISEVDMAIAMANQGAAAVIHRYNTVEEQATMIASIGEALKDEKYQLVGGAVGISGDFLKRATILRRAGAKFICVDVAHGHHILMKEALHTLRATLGNEFHIMAGNVATLAAINDLADWGANSVRCNIGGGSICSTRVQTGHGMAGLQTIMDCAKTDRDVKIIADGGIKTSGDIVKALAAGADLVMVGSLLAGANETPGEIITSKKGERWKIYRGMASKEAQRDWRGKYSSLEGVSTTVPLRGSVTDILEDLSRGIRSGFSYSGARTLEEMQARSQFVRQTTPGIIESGTHIMGRKW